MLSVTALNEPAVVASVTLSPPVVMLALPLSFSWTVMVDVLDPSAGRLVGAAVISEVAGSAKMTLDTVMVAEALMV